MATSERLVQQEHARVHDERPSEGHALLLAARQLPRLARLHAAQAHELEHLGGSPPALRPPEATLLQPVRHVVEHGEVREERVGLEHRVHVSLVGRDA
jgi:hypothetical protein